MSYMEMSDVRAMNDDAKFDAEIMIGDKETSKKFTTQGSSQDVNTIDQVDDGAFMGSAALVPVNQEELGSSKRVIKLTQKGWSIKFVSWKRRKLKSKLERK